MLLVATLTACFPGPPDAPASTTPHFRGSVPGVPSNALVAVEPDPGDLAAALGIQVRDSMQKQLDRDPGPRVKVDQVMVAHREGNEYRGIANLTTERGTALPPLLLDVTWDGIAGHVIVWESDPDSFERVQAAAIADMTAR
jgi:hypothetical protein